VIRDCESFEELAACTEDLSCLSMRTLEAAMWKLVRLRVRVPGGSTTGGKMRELAERLLETAFFPPDSMPEDASSERPRHWIIKAALVCSTRMSVKPRKGLFDEMCRQFVEQMDMFEHKDLVQFKGALHDWKQEGQLLPTHVYDEFLRALNGLPPPQRNRSPSPASGRRRRSRSRSRSPNDLRSKRSRETDASRDLPPRPTSRPSPRTNRTRLVPPPVLTGHVSSAQRGGCGVSSVGGAPRRRSRRTQAREAPADALAARRAPRARPLGCRAPGAWSHCSLGCRAPGAWSHC